MVFCDILTEYSKLYYQTEEVVCAKYYTKYKQLAERKSF